MFPEMESRDSAFRKRSPGLSVTLIPKDFNPELVNYLTVSKVSPAAYGTSLKSTNLQIKTNEAKNLPACPPRKETLRQTLQEDLEDSSKCAVTSMTQSQISGQRRNHIN